MEVFHEKVKPDASPLIRIKDPQGQIISRAQCEAALKSQGVKIHTPQTPQPSHGHMLARDVQLREGRFHLVHYPDKKTYELVPYRREHEPLRDTKIVVHRDASGRPGHITPRVTPERQPAMKAQAQDTSKAREASRLPNIKDICASMHQKLGYSVTPIQQGDTIKGVVLPQQVMTTQGRQQIIQETHEKGVNFYLVPASPELSALKGREVEIHQRPDRALEIKEKVPQIEKSPSRDR